MYVSKFFTCEEIDERLKQGYYDDFVSAGFVGSLQDFLAFVLSIKDKPGTEEVSGLLKNLEDKLNEAIGAVQKNLEEGDKTLDTKIDTSVSELEAKLEAQKVTKVSQLENDSNYQTEEQVKAYISALVNGADESLDTLLELAQALGNDPNFAATITEKLGQLKKAIEDEAARAKEKEAELQAALQEEVSKREDGDKAVAEAMENHVDRLSEALTSSFNNLDGKITTLQGQFQSLQQNYQTFTENVNTKLEKIAKDAQDANDSLESFLVEKIEAETARATKAEEAFEGKVEELKKKHDEDLQGIQDDIQANTDAIKQEAADRKAADLETQQKVLEEAQARSDMDATLLDKVSTETLNRITGDTALQEKLATEIADRKDAITDLKAELSDEKNARETADNTLSNDLEKLEIKHDNEISTLTQDLAAEVARAKAAEEDKVSKEFGKGLSTNDFTNALLEKLNGIQENANDITKVSELLNDSGFQTKAEVDAAIQNIIGSAPEVLDTLQEIAQALDNDPNFASTMLNRLASLTTQLNQEVEDRKSADNTLKLELLAKIKESTDSLGNSYEVLAERLESYKATANSQNEVTNGRIDALDSKLDQKVTYFTEKVTELSTKYTEKVNELNTKVNQFTTDIMARISAQDDLIQGNSANIQRNLELIQGLNSEIGDIKDTANTNLNTLLEAIRAEADARKAANEALTTKVDTNTQEIKNTKDALEELEQYVKDNPSNVTGSSTIDTQVRENSEGKTETVVSVKVDPDERILVPGTTGLRTDFNFKKTETENGLIYQLVGANGKPVEGVEPIEVPEATPFTEEDSREMYDEIYGDEFDPETANNLIGMTENEIAQMYNEVYNT